MVSHHEMISSCMHSAIKLIKGQHLSCTIIERFTDIKTVQATIVIHMMKNNEDAAIQLMINDLRDTIRDSSCYSLRLHKKGE